MPAPRTDPKFVINENGCWIWQWAVSNSGYGVHAGQSAHRYMYEKHVGPIPDGLWIDHLCRTKRCVNPAHLEPVTPAENQRRGRLAKLTSADVIAIRLDVRRHADVAERYGVDPGTIASIRSGRIAADLPMFDVEYARREKKWTPETVTSAMLRFRDRYGRSPSATDFNPSAARRAGQDWRADRYYRDGDYPPLASVQVTCGSWSAALIAAGLRPLPTGHPARAILARDREQCSDRIEAAA